MVEREWELAALEQQLAYAREGSGGVSIVEAPAGKGKSRLLTVAGDMARASGMQVVGAYGTRLERDFPFGAAIQLFEPRWFSADASERLSLLEGPARLASPLLSGRLPDESMSGGDESYALIHGLFWLTCNLVGAGAEEVAGGPLVMLVDDAHHIDRPSLHFLAYLAERIEDLPIVIVLAVREGEAAADPGGLLAITRLPWTRVLRPGALSASGVQTLVQGVFPQADEAFCSACASLTRGNPFLLTAVIAQMRADGTAPDRHTAERLGEMTPESVLNAVVERLAGMPPATGALARAVAVLGDGAQLRHAAALARLDPDEAAAAADALAASHMFHAGTPLSFVHPLIAAAVTASMSPLARGQVHSHAAALLDRDGATPEAVAAHLLAAPPGDDPRAIQILRTAARAAFASGAPQSAVKLLERAISERPDQELLPELLAELGQAEAIAGLPEAAERLGEALRLTADPRRRTELGLAQAQALHGRGHYRQAASIIEAELEKAGTGSELWNDLVVAYVCSASAVPELAAGTRRYREQILDRSDELTVIERRALAHAALGAGCAGESKGAVRRLATLAWSEGALLTDQTGAEISWPALAGGLLYADELERALVVCDSAALHARERDSPLSFAAASHCRAWAQYHRGRIVDAAADAQSALGARPAPWASLLPSPLAVIALCHIEREELEQAERVLSVLDEDPPQDPVQRTSLLDARAQLRIAQRQAAEALSDARDAGARLANDAGEPGPGVVPWRSTVALACLALGDADQARELATEELGLAREVGVSRHLIRSLRVLALTEGDAGLGLLEETAEIAADYPARLESIRTLVDLGAALRRSNKRAAARDPLRKGLELARRGGATASAKHAQTELAASGARPRRLVLSGVEALTPSERRVADLAASGLTTRQIAETLFITAKTVEFHLRHIYQKLDVRSRSQLAETLHNRA